MATTQYKQPTPVKVPAGSGGGGSGATAVAVLGTANNAGVVTSVNVLNYQHRFIKLKYNVFTIRLFMILIFIMKMKSTVRMRKLNFFQNSDLKQTHTIKYVRQ